MPHILLFIFLILFPLSKSSPPTICIVGGGISGSSAAHFLRHHTTVPRIILFERNAIPGGRTSIVTISGDTFEAGASILHPKNYHSLNFTKLLNLHIQNPGDSQFSLGIWNGNRFIFKTLDYSSFPLIRRIVSFANSAFLFWRYGFSLIRMNAFVQAAVDNFCNYYQSYQSRPVFQTVEDMLKWSSLYNLTAITLQRQLLDSGISPLLIEELVTVITRINYGQNVGINALSGAVSLAGSGGGLWSVKGGNWQIASGLIKNSGVELHLNEEIVSIANRGPYYELNSTKGNSYVCNVTVVATPLDETDIKFAPPISIPGRKLQHTHATFVRGLLNPTYFGLHTASDIPDLVGTIEDPNLPFTCISVIKKYNEKDMAYKIFSRKPISDKLLDNIFSVRKETVCIDWAAYPHYNAPEVFAPFILDGRHLYYVNALENAASTIETGAVAAENIARLIVSRVFSQNSSDLKISNDNQNGMHLDL